MALNPTTTSSHISGSISPSVLLRLRPLPSSSAPSSFHETGIIVGFLMRILRSSRCPRSSLPKSTLHLSVGESSGLVSGSSPSWTGTSSVTTTKGLAPRQERANSTGSGFLSITQTSLSSNFSTSEGKAKTTRSVVSSLARWSFS